MGPDKCPELKEQPKRGKKDRKCNKAANIFIVVIRDGRKPQKLPLRATQN